MKFMEFGSLLTADEKFAQTLSLVENIASSKATVLISGESGCGKELVARLIHEKSPRASKRFVAINCAAVPEGLLESELFGFERGAFTGATQPRQGKFELADEGTILLDEISEMSLLLQSKLLRVLQEEEVERLGAREPISVNLRVIATTNRDLRQMVSEGKFREDLFYRLNVIPIQVPSLRQRPDDISLLAQHFMKVSAILNGRAVTEINADALEKLRNWNWPGNVRELENVMERAVLIAQTSVVGINEIVIENFDQKTGYLDLDVGLTVAEVEKRLILKTLQRTDNNRTQAARILGISIRTLRNKLAEYREMGVAV